MEKFIHDKQHAATTDSAALEAVRLLKELADSHRLTNHALGQVVGVPRTTIYKWKHGLAKPSDQQVALIMQASTKLQGLSPKPLQTKEETRDPVRPGRRTEPEFSEASKILGRLVDSYRLTEQAIGEASNVSQTTVSRWLSGVSKPSEQQLILLKNLSIETTRVMRGKVINAKAFLLTLATSDSTPWHDRVRQHRDLLLHLRSLGLRLYDIAQVLAISTTAVHRMLNGYAPPSRRKIGGMCACLAKLLEARVQELEEPLLLDTTFHPIADEQDSCVAAVHSLKLEPNAGLNIHFREGSLPNGCKSYSLVDTAATPHTYLVVVDKNMSLGERNRALRSELLRVLESVTKEKIRELRRDGRTMAEIASSMRMTRQMVTEYLNSK